MLGLTFCNLADADVDADAKDAEAEAVPVDGARMARAAAERTKAASFVRVVSRADAVCREERSRSRDEDWRGFKSVLMYFRKQPL